MDFSDVTVVLPSLDPDHTLVDVVESLLHEGFRDVILVNDGSGSQYLQPFLRAAIHQEVTLLTHEVNRGKGAAMKTAFSYILEHRPRSAGAVTVDGDGQHLARDVKSCAQRMVETGQVVLGCRDFGGPEVPWRSRMGNLITRTVFRLFCGISVSDTQTGLRAFPRRYLELLCATRGERYEYETEMLFTLKREQAGILEQRIETVYEPGDPTSHFSSFRDSWAIYKRIVAFAASSGTSFLVDYGLFALLDLLLRGLSRDRRLFWAYFGARAASSLVNDTMNQQAVFHSDAPAHRTIAKYYVL